jgi:hypothetical protein
MKAGITCALAFLAVAALSTVLDGQAQPQKPSITGKVYDSSKALIPGVTITITNTDPKADPKTLATALTSETGTYAFTGLPAGTYTLTAQLQGFQPTTLKIDLAAGSTSEQNVTLALGLVRDFIRISPESGDSPDGSMVRRPSPTTSYR